ncbi:unnamed protein product, partial [Urochloa humidicola]
KREEANSSKVLGRLLLPMAMAARLLRRTLRATEVAPRFLSASHGLVHRAAYASGGIVDVGQLTPQSHPE